MAERGLFGVIEDTMTSPLWLGGAALLSGEGFGGALRGMQLGAGFRQQRRQQEEEEAARQRFQSLFENGGISGIDPAFSRLAQTVGPQEGSKILADALLAKMRADRAAASGGRAGLQVIYGVDDQGNPVALQPTDTGQLVRSQMPAGVTISREPLRFDAGTHFVLMDPITRQQIGVIPKDIAGAESAKVTGKAQGEAAVELPAVIQKGEEALALIQGAIDHPGRATATGLSGYIDPRSWLPGTNARDFLARHRQLEGRAFLEAYQMLKGGGQITEIEGQKAERAIARLDTAQSDEAYLEALEDLKEVFRAGINRARQRAGVAAPQQSGPDRVEATKTINGKTYVKIGGQWYEQ